MPYTPPTNHKDILKSIIDEMKNTGVYSSKSINHLSNIIENILSLQNVKDLNQIDIDALKIVADGVNRMRGAGRSFLVITHYQRLLDYIVPDVVHVLAKGRIVKTGGPELAKELEAKGYAGIEEAA